MRNASAISLTKIVLIAYYTVGHLTLVLLDIEGLGYKQRQTLKSYLFSFV